MDNRMEEAARSQQEYVVETRRALHRSPETRYETPLTRERILAEIASLSALAPGNATIRLPVEFKGGIAVDIDVEGCPDRILFRADFDALPVHEETGLDYASLREGYSHACGHDANTAMLLGFLKCVTEGKIVPGHCLRLVFQDAEENPGASPEPLSGGDLLVRDGVLDGVSFAYALHIMSGEEATNGVFRSRPGAMFGNSGRIRFLFTSSGGHAGAPSAGVNALRVAHAAMNGLDTFAARCFSPTEPVALEPVILRSGTGSNVMPAHAELWYGFRTLLPRESHIEMTARLIDEVRTVAAAMQAFVEAEPFYGHPSLVNDPGEYLRVAALLHNAGQKAEEGPPSLGGEDFAHYLHGVPGAMFMLGAHKRGSGGQHSPTFDPDEGVFWKGVLFWALLAG
jgi:amidohydrolase